MVGAATSVTVFAEAPHPCGCGLGARQDWALVLDARHERDELLAILQGGVEGTARVCDNCGRELLRPFPLFVVAMLGTEPAVLLWQPRPDIEVDAWRPAAAARLRAADPVLADNALGAPPLSTGQLRAVLLHEPEINLYRELADGGVDHEVLALLRAAERLHNELGPEECCRELAAARTYGQAALIGESHPSLRTPRGAAVLGARVAELAARGRHHASGDLVGMTGDGRGRDEHTTDTLEQSLGRLRIQLAEPAAAALREAAGPGSRDLRDLTWLGLLHAVRACRRHKARCGCPAVIQELLARVDVQASPDPDVGTVIAELAAILADSDEGARGGRLAAAAALNEWLLGSDALAPRARAHLNLNLAKACSQWNDTDAEARLDQGKAAVERALEFFETERERDPKIWASAAATLGGIYAARLAGDRDENLRQAVHWLELAAQAQAREDDPAGHSLLLGHLADALLKGGARPGVEQAVGLLRGTREFHNNAGMLDRARVDSLNLARALEILNDWASLREAESILREVIAAETPTSAPDAWLDAALQLANLLLTRLPPDGHGPLRRKQLGEAVELLQVCHELCRQRDDRRAVRLTGHLLGTGLLQQGDVPAASRAFDDSVLASEAIRTNQKDKAVRRHERMADEEIFLLAATAHSLRGDNAAALTTLERLRGRELLIEVHQQTEIDLDGLDGLITGGVGALYAWSTQGMTFFMLLTKAADGRLEPLLAQSALLAVPAEGPDWGTVVVHRPAAAPARRGPVAFNACPAGRVPDFDALRVPLDELGSPLVSTLVQRGIHSIYIVACGALANVAWGLLPGPGEKPLGTMVGLTMTPSLSWQLAQRRRGRQAQEPAGTALVVDVEEAGRDLPYAAAEADAIEAVLGADRLRNPRKAELQNALGGRPQAHFVGHGRTDQRPQLFNAGLTRADFASGPVVDPVTGPVLNARYEPIEHVGLLLAGGEALKPADLAASAITGPQRMIIAACDGAVLPRQRLADELDGLPWAVLASGAREVVAALWPVDDDASCLLMIRLHELLLDGQSAAAALRLAQGWLLDATVAEVQVLVARHAARANLVFPGARARADPSRPYASPEFWAPFVLIA